MKRESLLLRKGTGKSIRDQINEDRHGARATVDIIKNKDSGGRTMSESLTEISLDDLERLRDALDTFVVDMKKPAKKWNPVFHSVGLL